MSSATSRPWPAAAWTRWRKSSRRPRSGCTALGPPSCDPISHGLPGSPGAAGLKRLRKRLQARGVGGAAVRASGGLLDHPRPSFQLDGDVLPGLDALGELAAPGLVVVDPALHREHVPAEVGDRKLAPPAVVDQLGHRRL